MLEKINSPADLRSLSYPELDALCAEIREFLLDTISVTGAERIQLGIAQRAQVRGGIDLLQH